MLKYNFLISPKIKNVCQSAILNFILILEQFCKIVQYLVKSVSY